MLEQDPLYECYVNEAACQLKHFVFGVWGITADEIEAAHSRDSVYGPDLDNFEDEYGISYEEATKHLAAFVARYIANYDVELTAVKNWETAIEYVLKELKSSGRTHYIECYVNKVFHEKHGIGNVRRFDESSIHDYACVKYADATVVWISKEAYDVQHRAYLHNLKNHIDMSMQSIKKGNKVHE